MVGGNPQTKSNRGKYFKHKRKSKAADSIKVGHGGTLDPLATGVLGISCIHIFFYEVKS